MLAYYQGLFDQVKHWLEECLALQTSLSEHEIAWAQLTLALVVHDQLDFTRASSLYAESLQRFRCLNDEYGIIRVLNSQGALASDIGDLEAADKLFGECLVLSRKRGDKENMAIALTNLGWTAAMRDDIVAIELCQEAVTLFCDLGNKLGIAFSVEGVAAGFAFGGQSDRAVRLLG
jgi:tetratricopeptide (TPR) repeat protein